MSHDPSHRKPPRQERWPSATPPEGWRPYRDGGAYRDGNQADGQYGTDRQGAYQATAGYPRQAGYRRDSGGPGDRGYQSAVATDAFAATRNGYGTGGYAGDANGYAGAANGYAGDANGYAGGANGYAGAVNGYAGDANGYAGDANGYAGAVNGYAGGVNGYAGGVNGYADAADDFAGSAGYRGPGRHAEPRHSGPMLMAPDAGVYPDSWQADQERRREAGRRGLIVGAVTGFLAAAVAISVSTLAAAFVRPQASPMTAVGGVFTARTPSALKHLAVQQFGANDRTVLLLGMYVTIAVLATAVGVLSRRAVALGVAGVAAFSLFGAFVTITRPGSRLTDLVPSVIGGMAGVAALIWLARASAPVAPVRRAHGGGRRRTR
jgi:hypothetical protein